MVAFILPANSATGGYEIDNSYRIDSGSAVGLARFGNNSRNGDTFTISFWVKRTKLGTNQILVCSKAEDSGSNGFVFQFKDSDKIKIQGQPQAGTTGAGANRVVILTTAVYRDTSAWYHIVYRQDTTQGTAGNRHRLYVNGVLQATDTNDALDQNTEFLFFYNAGSFPYAIGNDERDNLFADWYMAEHHYTDGVSNGPDAFGETNDNGVWIPKQYGGSHGTYGHYLKFKQSGAGSGTTVVGEHDYTTGTASTIGADSSGNDHHFHVQGYSVQDNTTDTPTNNFATFNPIFPDYATGSLAIVLSEGNCKAVYTGGGSGGNGMKRSSIAVANGKWYAEFKITATNAASDDDFGIGVVPVDNYETGRVAGDHTGGVVYKHTGQKRTDAGGNADYGDSFDDGDIIGVALDMDNGQVFFYKNGTIQNSGTAAATSLSGTYVMMAQANDTANHNHTVEVNFGNPSFAISSGNTDGKYGNFEFAVPSGYFALCTKNLAEYG